MAYLRRPFTGSFRTRCPYVTQACAHDEPVWREVGPEHWVAAFHCIG